jgi:large subunit ribosomal protein L10
MFKGPTAIAFSRDPVAAAKVAVEFSGKNEKLKVIGGGLGDKMLDPTAIKALATLPSLPELRAKLLGTIVAPATRLATVIRAPASQLARVIDAKAKKTAEG